MANPPYSCQSLKEALEKVLQSEKTLDEIAVKFCDTELKNSSLTYKELKAL